jgi:CRP/FNR family transcriptional regulator
MKEITMLKHRTGMNVNCATCPVSTLCLPLGLNEFEIKSLNSIISRTVVLKKGEHLYFENEPMNNIYALYSGYCKEYAVDKEGNEKVFGFSFPGDMVAVESIHKKQYNNSCAALKDSVLCVIPCDEFFKLMYTSPQILKRFVLLLSQKTSNSRYLITTTNAKRRIASFLMGLLKNSTEKEKNEKIYLPMSQIDIGNLLGMTHETVSRIFKSFQSKEIIKIKDKSVYIHDKNLLQNLAF